MENDKKVEEQKANKTNKIKTITLGGSSIVILRNRGLTDNVSELENKYSQKFGCKVIILESNIDYVDKING